MRARFQTFITLTATLVLGSQSIAPCAAQDEQISANSPVKDKWAVVIGVSSFSAPEINLKYAAKDAEDFKNFLIDKCHFANDHVKLLTNEAATRDRILDVLGDSWLPRVSLSDDLVVIFISTHGSPAAMDVMGVNYLVAYDTNPEKLFTTGIPLQRLADTIKERVHSKRVLVILDTCFSGSAGGTKSLYRSGNVDANAIALGTGHVVICSSSKSEVSWESKKYKNGVFTRTLMDALLAKGENTKLGEAFAQLKDRVEEQVAAERGVVQTPVLEASKWKGNDLVLAVMPTNPRKVPEDLETDEEAPAKAIGEVNFTGNFFNDSKTNPATLEFKPVSRNLYRVDWTYKGDQDKITNSTCVKSDNTVAISYWHGGKLGVAIYQALQRGISGRTAVKQTPMNGVASVTTQPETLRRSSSQSPYIPTEPKDWAGTYAVIGDADNGAQYSGKLILKKNDDYYTARWLIEGGEEFEGLGVAYNDSLAIGFRSGSGAGVILYQGDADGKLRGIWALANPDSKDFFWENATKIKPAETEQTPLIEKGSSLRVDR